VPKALQVHKVHRVLKALQVNVVEYLITLQHQLQTLIQALVW
jgi:hypothetical protein